MRRRVRRLKRCEETTCGYTCIDTQKICRINNNQPIRIKTIKLKRLITQSKQLSNRLDPAKKLVNINDFEGIIQRLSDKSRDRLLSSIESRHILSSLLAQEKKSSSKRQWITQEEKDAVLEWWANGQKNKKNYRVLDDQVKTLWDETGYYDRKLRQQLTVKGNVKYRYDNTMTAEERGEFILSLYLRSGGTCAITGLQKHWTDLEPDHKNPALGDVADNLFLIHAPINKNKGKKTWDEYVAYLQKYDPAKKRAEAERQSAYKASMFVEYLNRVRSGTIDLSSPTPTDEFKNQGTRLKALTKILSTHPTGKYAIVTQPNKRTNVGTVNTAYQLLRYRLGYIKFRDIPEYVWEELTRNSSKSLPEIEKIVKLTFDPKVSKSRVNPKFEPVS